MGVLEESEVRFVRIADRLKALQENANKWQPKQTSENLPHNEQRVALKERRKVFSSAASANDVSDNKSANFTIPKTSALNRRNQSAVSTQEQQIKPFQTVKLTKRPADCGDKSLLLSSQQFLIDDHHQQQQQPKNTAIEHDVDDEVRANAATTGEQPSHVLKSREEPNKTEMSSERDEEEVKLSYLLPATKKEAVSRPNRRLPTRFQKAANVSVDSKLSVSLNSELYLETEDKENQEQSVCPKRPNLRVSSAVPFQAPIIGKEHCGVQLRHVDRLAPFPDPMLIRALCVGKRIDLRLVKPTKCSATDQGAYLLVTSKKFIIRNGSNSTVQERSKIAQLAHEIVAGKEMFGYSGKPELANEDGLAEASFWRHLNEEESEKTINEIQQFYTKSFDFYQIDESGEANKIECDAVSASILDSNQVLVLDFGSEIYTWLGRNCNRSLSKFATTFADKLKSGPLSHEMSKFIGIANAEEKRPSWILTRRLSEAIADALFGHKFAIDSAPKPNAPFQKSPRIEGRTINLPSKFCNNLRPKVVAQNLQLKDEDTLAQELASKFAQFKPSNEGFMELEDTQIKPFDSNVHTEQLNFFVLSGETLDALEEQPNELDCHKCYVVEWRYRIEKTVQKLNHTEAKKHDTGRERGVYFYWLGQESTVKEQSFCAIALRNKDRERLEHIRLEQGHEHPLFISLFNENGFIVSGTDSNTFLFHSYGHEDKLLSMVEMRSRCGRTQTAMAQIVNNELHCQRGKFCTQRLWENAQQLASKLANIRQLQLKCSETMDFDCLQPQSWTQSPRFYRIYELEGEVLLTNRAHFTFPAHQSDLADGCTLIENDESLWLWSENVISTFALKVANNFWTKERNHDANVNATAICKGNEPPQFMALFPEWEDKVDESECQSKSTQSLGDLLNERTKNRSLQEVRERRLPNGCDLKHLEQYLSDEDFESVFKMSKAKFEEQPKWKQIAMKKDANLF